MRGQQSEKTTAPGESGKNGRRNRWRRWQLVLGVILGLLVAVYLIEVYRCSRFEPTGDALFDRYARAVISKQKWSLFRYAHTHPATLTDSELAKWEEEFGDRPEYWQLRYWSAGLHCFLSEQSCMLPSRSALEGEKISNPEQFLELTADRGTADGRTSLMLARYGEWTNSAVLLSHRQRWLAGDEGSSASISYSGHAEKIRQHWLPELERLIEDEPDQACLYYDRSLTYFGLGESKLAIDDLIKGNQAADYGSADSYPRSFVLEQVALGKNAGNPVLAGAIVEFNLGIATRLLSWSKVCDGVLPQLPRDQQAVLAEELLEFFLRFPGDYPDINESQVSLLLLDRLLMQCLILDYGKEENTVLRKLWRKVNHRESLYGIYARNQHRRYGFSLQSMNYYSFYGMPGGDVETVAPEPWPDVLSVRSLILLQTWYAPMAYRFNYRKLKDDRKYLDQLIKPVYTELEGTSLLRPVNTDSEQ